MEDSTKIIIGIIIAVVLIASPIGVAIVNNYAFASPKVDDLTNYKTKKEVEDTCRSLIVSYESDKLMYEQYKDSDNKEEKSWANNAKIRANKTAITYNEYVLKNSYVFQGNIPEDIKEELEIIG